MLDQACREHVVQTMNTVCILDVVVLGVCDVVRILQGGILLTYMVVGIKDVLMLAEDLRIGEQDALVVVVIDGGDSDVAVIITFHVICTVFKEN